MEKEFRVSFLPDSKHVYVIKGTPVFEAASRAGILLAAPCGGEGKCGKCRVKVIKGRLQDPAETEKTALKPEEIKEGIRLACQAVITGACTFEVPSQYRVDARNILVSGRMKSVKLNPGTRKKFIDPDSFSPGRDASYYSFIRKETGCLTASTDALRDVPGLALENPEGMTAVCAGSELKALEKGDTTRETCGIALDLGTTTLAASLLDLGSGDELAVSSKLNPQFRFGDDLISRINFASKSPRNLEKISGSVVSAINEIIRELSKKAGIPSRRIYRITIAGNTVMQHIFCRISPESLGKLPFIPVTGEPVRMSAADAGIDISRAGDVYVFPAIGGFVGGDAVAAALASGIASSTKKRILVDIGTNGEIIAGSSDKLFCASAAAGPAFESARIEMGMIASPGAIEKVIINGDVHVNVIGNKQPTGICGSGLLDAAARMLEAGLISSSGKILSGEELPRDFPPALVRRIRVMNGESAFLLSGEDNHNKVYVTQRDIRELQLAKSAIYSAIRILKRKLGIRLEDLEEVLIAGAFGNFLRRSSAKRIGLIPDIPSKKIKFIGNASSAGAKLLLLSNDMEKEAARIARKAIHVELSSSGSFQSEFAEHMLFPE